MVQVFSQKTLLMPDAVKTIHRVCRFGTRALALLFFPAVWAGSVLSVRLAYVSVSLQ